MAMNSVQDLALLHVKLASTGDEQGVNPVAETTMFFVGLSFKRWITDAIVRGTHGGHAHS
jgi:hypothetical protein